LYDWNTAMDYVSGSNSDPSGIEGVCPVGWHIPSDAEWIKLIHFLGDNAATKMKSVDFGHYGYSSGGGRDTDHFEALGGGIGSLLSTSFFPNIGGEGPPWFFGERESAYWWTTSEYDNDNHKAWARFITGSMAGVMDINLDKHYMMSVRCVHD
jgi:uncharacterized protein (TIGR02145 family)